MIVIILLVVSGILVPVFASAQTDTSLEAQLASLLSQIAQLQQGLQATSAASAQAAPTYSSPGSTVQTGATPANSQPIICPTLVRTLSLGSSGTDVANLQGFLAQNPLIYPEGTVTGYFGMFTQDAVQRWQSAYGVVSSGSPATTGYGIVGAHTRAAIAASCATETQYAPYITSGSIISTTTSSGLPVDVCPIAQQPATPCPGTWSAMTNTNGCTIAWQCAVPLPSATSATTAPATQPSNGQTSASSCPAYTLPSCTGGTTIWLGTGSNGCNLGYQCVHPGQ